jgi:hypothetical protein
MYPLKLPKPETTLAVILGASSWPHHTEFQASISFRKSAEAFRDYLLDENGFKLPLANLCYLFDSPQTSMEIISKISQFLHERNDILPRDLIVYYVGHGGFRESTSEYYLAIQMTQRPDLYLSSIPIQSLATSIKEEARFLRRYIILDSCFSAAAYVSFQSGPIEVAFQKIADALPEAGTALLCSSGPREPSKAPPDLEHTMFTGALIEILRQGYNGAIELFSIQDLYILIRRLLSDKFEDNAILPEIHAPDQRHGNVSEVPLFPNPVIRESNLKPAQINNTTQESSVKKVDDKAREIESALWELYYGGNLPKSVFLKAIDILDTNPEDLNEENNSYYILLYRFSTLTPGNFLEEWWKIKVKYLTATLITDAVSASPLNFSGSIQARRPETYG